MSGIFDLFTDSSNGPMEVSRKSSVTGMNSGNIGAKNIGLARPKPKGLSIRSSSDLNVPNVQTAKSPKRKSPLKGQYLAAEAGFSRSLSPRSREKGAKLQTLKSKQLKAQSTKSKSPNHASPPENIQADANLFRKPFTPIPRNKARVYPEPDSLSKSYKEEEEELYVLDREFVRLVNLSKPPVQPYMDEGFESDPELVETPSFDSPVTKFVDQNDSYKTPSLPSLSDDEDDFLN